MVDLVVHEAAEKLFRRPSEEVGGRAVDEGGPALAVQADDALPRGLQDRLVADAEPPHLLLGQPPLGHVLRRPSHEERRPSEPLVTSP